MPQGPVESGMLMRWWPAAVKCLHTRTANSTSASVRGASRLSSR
jgi:hypothetical protein